MRLTVDLTMPTEARLLCQTRQMFSGYLEEMGADEDDVADVVLAVAEACSNVVRHAFPTSGECFRLSADMGPDEVVVIVEDDGVGLPPDAGDGPLDSEATSGRGLQLIRKLMTSVEVETTPARLGTRLRMSKLLRAPSLSAAD